MLTKEQIELLAVGLRGSHSLSCKIMAFNSCTDNFDSRWEELSPEVRKAWVRMAEATAILFRADFLQKVN